MTEIFSKNPYGATWPYRNSKKSILRLITLSMTSFIVQNKYFWMEKQNVIFSLIFLKGLLPGWDGICAKRAKRHNKYSLRTKTVLAVFLVVFELWKWPIYQKCSKMLSASELFGSMTKICIVQALEPKIAYCLEKKKHKNSIF